MSHGFKEPRQIRARRAEEVDLFLSQKPERPYAEVAYIKARQESPYSFDESSDVLLKLREYAGRMGCDGLLVLGASSDIVATGSGPYNIKTLHGHSAVCIHYNDDARARRAE